MTLTPTGELVSAAAASGRGVGSFNVITVEHAEAIAAGAERAGSPVVMQISENCVRYHGALAPIAAATLSVARAAEVSVAIHLDHARSPDLVVEAMDLGISSVMFDASVMSYADNVSHTRSVVEGCHGRGTWVEAELGEVGGKDGVHAPGARTDPAEAVRYVAATGVDALAVAVGTSHAMLTRDAKPDLDLIGRIRSTVDVPLVLHGSSGVPDDDLARAVGHGMTKINIATQLNKVFTAATREALAADPAFTDPRKYLGLARDATAGEVARLLAVLRA